MSLKDLPITLAGKLHDIEIVHFTVDLEEMKQHIPSQLKVRSVGGKSVVSLVNVTPHRMGPQFLPPVMRPTYQAFLFRTLLEDAEYNEEKKDKGLYFTAVRSPSFMARTGLKLFTDIVIESCVTTRTGNRVDLRTGDRFVRYELDDHAPVTVDPEIEDIANTLDRAYTVNEDGVVRRVVIERYRWPLKQVACKDFATNFFKSAEPRACYKVTEIIDYIWKPFEVIARPRA
ncbi:Uncharacterized protein YqjF, DUF2071 family [Myxococcus fulvus]|uniref:Uncharacterized protein YqjF, DUF2071 family n=1 Tax=Myxococcus fulvus TaxID=33 RepID=A0A511TCC6_MYXFU|nr:DUF2071 domain-containing protein [Myxococcus fulvus]AKF85192.1 hypothetical protein MFUL124B02_10335 [Myxococcus fulvus 124B02]GEN11829.1 hypothetical protein MFU01_68660 [Myxococcus fulvus]SEU38586.1 Uncharacterized protein YqjF, DUF2071 family [Myxococcus fulvus]